MKQFSLFKPSPATHGGELALHRRKAIRPLAKKRPIHLILKAKKSFGGGGALVHSEALRLARKFQLRVYDTALARDHLHLVIRIPGRREYTGFIRALTGVLARKLGKGLWRLLPFTRVSSWGKAYRELLRYLEQNRLEEAGLIPYEKRRDWYEHQKRRASPG